MTIHFKTAADAAQGAGAPGLSTALPANAPPPPAAVLLKESAATITAGGVEEFTVVTKGYTPGTILNWILSGPGLDQVTSSLTGSVVLDANGRAYIVVTTAPGGDFAPQDVTLTLGRATGSFTIDDASTVNTYTLGSTKETLNLTTANNLVVGNFGYVTNAGNEAGGTLLPGDVINGGSTNTTLNMQQSNGTGGPDGRYYDLMPQGVSITGVNTFIVDSVQAVGSASQLFDTTGIDHGGLATLNIAETLGQDFVRAAAVTNVAITDFGGLVVDGAPQPGSILLDGGASAKLTGGSAVGAGAQPFDITADGVAGAVTILDNSQADGAGHTNLISVDGGSAISVTGAGAVSITDGNGAYTLPNGNVVTSTAADGNVTVTDTGTDLVNDTVSVLYGLNVAITTSGGAVTASGMTGSATVADTGLGSAVNITGGDGVTVTANGGAVTISQSSGAISANAGSGAVSIYAPSAGNISATGGNITIDGGVNVTAVSSGTVVIGGAVHPTGNITVTDSSSGSIFVAGGINDTVTGYGQIRVNGAYHAGTITVNADNSGASGGIITNGGNVVNVNVNAGYESPEDVFYANSTSVQIGAVPNVTNIGGITTIPNIGADPNGNVAVNYAYDPVNSFAPTEYGVGQVTIYTNGTTQASITGGADALIEDVQTIPLISTPGGTPTPGISHLATLSLTGVGGSATFVSDAITTVSISNSGTGSAYGNGFNQSGPTVLVDQDRNDHALSVSVSNNQSGTGLVDATATSLSITAGVTSAALNVDAALATSIAISGSSVVTLTAATQAAAIRTLHGVTSQEFSGGLDAVTTITVTGNAGVNDGGPAGGFNTYAALATINAAASHGAITVALNGYQTFTGGTGQDIVTLTTDVMGGFATVTGGSAGDNILVADNVGSAFTIDDTGQTVRGFSELRVIGSSAGTYDMQRVFDNIANVDVATAGAGAETFANSAGTFTLAIDQGLGEAGTGAGYAGVTLGLIAGAAPATVLNLSLGQNASTASPGTAGVDAADGAAGAAANGLGGGLLETQNYVTVNVASAGTINPLTGLSAGTNYVNLGDSALTTLTVSGVENLTIGDAASAVRTISLTGAAASAFIDLSLLATSINGATLAAGAAGFDFTGNVSSLKTDTVTFATASTAVADISEKGTGALWVQGALANGAVTITSAYSALLATLGNGNDVITGSNATNTITAGNGTDTVTLGNGNNTVTLGSGTGDVVTVGNGNNTISVAGNTSLPTGFVDTVVVGTGNNTVTLGAGLEQVVLNGIGPAGALTFISGAAVGDQLAFVGAPAAGAAWENGSATNAQVILPPNGTLTDYLNVACSAAASTGSQFAWFDFGGNQYLVEDNNSAANQGFLGGIDQVAEFKGTGTLNGDMTIGTAFGGAAVTFHS